MMPEVSETSPLLFRENPTDYRDDILRRRYGNSSINSDSQSRDLTRDLPVALVTVVQPKIYHRRWYILFLFSVTCFNQNMVWNTWGPLTNPAEVGFGYGTFAIAWLTNWGMITYVITAFFFCWVMDTKGLRISGLVSSFLVALGAALRCVSCDPNTAKWFVHAGHIFNGFAGTIVMSAPPVLSAAWFAPHERTIATSISLLSMSFGVAGSFIVSPLLVPNATLYNNSDISEPFQFGFENYTCGMFNCSASVDDNEVLLARRNIMRLMYLEGAWCVLTFILTVVYFPALPPTPPSITASLGRVDFGKGFCSLLRHRAFLKVGICYAISMGISDIWSSLLNFYVPDTINADYLGFYAMIGSAVAGCLVSVFADYFSRHLRSILLTLYTVAALTCILFALESQHLIPTYAAIIYVSFIVTTVGIQSCSPIFFELVCETSYPIAEGVTNGLSTWMNNLVGFIFTLVVMADSKDPTRSKQWMNWVMLGSILFCLPVLFAYRDRYNRLDIDDVTPTVTTTPVTTTPNGATPHAVAPDTMTSPATNGVARPLLLNDDRPPPYNANYGAPPLPVVDWWGGVVSGEGHRAAPPVGVWGSGDGPPSKPRYEGPII